MKNQSLHRRKTRHQRVGLALIIASVSSWAFGQEQSDSLSMSREAGLNATDIEELMRPLGLDSIGLPMDANYQRPLRQELPLSTTFNTANPYQFLWRNPSYRTDYLPRWSNGYMYGSHGTSVNMMFGYLTTADWGISQQLGEYWTASAYMGLQKYSVYYNTATVGGSVTWHPTDWFSATAFGAYSPGSFLSSVQIGPSFQWGGYISLQTETDVPFGVDVGARESYDPMNGHVLTPIVQPYVKLGGAKLGIDFGPMLRDAIWKDNRSREFNPIPQPIKAIPQVAPRR